MLKRNLLAIVTAISVFGLALAIYSSHLPDSCKAFQNAEFIPVTSSPQNEFIISWSPDSSKIVYNSENQVWVFDLNSKTRERLTKNGTFLDGKFSPDGKKIVFVSIHNDSSDICVMDYKTRVTECFEMNGKNLNPKWSPDGSKIAFVRIDEAGRHLWVMNADGKDQMPLTEDMGRVECWNYDWSPNGSRIAFSAKISGKREIWVMNADGSGKRRIGIGVQPEWQTGRELCFLNNSTLYCANVESKEQKSIAERVGHYTLHDALLVHDYGFNVILLCLNSKEEIELTKSGHDMLPIFSPDGKKVAFTTDRFGNFDVWIVSRTG